MRANFSIHSMTWGFSILGFVVLLMGWGRAQDTIQAANSPNAWEQYDWLKPTEDQQGRATPGTTLSATAGQDVKDPFAVLSTDSLLQEKYGAAYTRRLSDTVSLSCETSAVMLTDGSEDLSNGQKVGLQFQPMPNLTLSGNLHDSVSDAPLPENSTITHGAGFSAESHLPLNASLTLGLDTDSTSPDTNSGCVASTNAYDAQLKQPVGKLPLTAVLKGHYEETSQAGAPTSSLPSLEQSLVWKPLQDTTVQMGLRQQQYQEYPGVDDLLNEALFADWSQQVVDDVTWHSYAEVINSRGLTDQAPAAPIASGANGTPQATTPGSNASLTSSLPVSLDDQTLTFSTGPSFQLEKDISASVEYSNRWDKNPAPGSMGPEQRVSISVKGTF